MRLTVITLVLTALIFAGCSRKQEQPPQVEPEQTTPPAEMMEPTEEPASSIKEPEPAAAKPPATPVRKLMDPGNLAEKAPATYRAKFVTSKGDFIVEVTRDWAPFGADRFYNLVKNGYYDDCRFFRVIDNFMVQFGINGDPALNVVWNSAQFKDDPVKESNQRGFITFAMSSMPNSRTTQVFINYRDNANLDSQRFAPFGKVIEGMEVVDSLYGEYQGEPSNNQPRIQAEGNAYLNKTFPRLDYIKSAVIVKM